MKKVIIESSNMSDTPAEIEETLQKAMSSLQAQRENRPIKDTFLKEQIENGNNLFHKIIDSMISELTEVVK